MNLLFLLFRKKAVCGKLIRLVYYDISECILNYFNDNVNRDVKLCKEGKILSYRESKALYKASFVPHIQYYVDVYTAFCKIESMRDEVHGNILPIVLDIKQEIEHAF